MPRALLIRSEHGLAIPFNLQGEAMSYEAVALQFPLGVR